jgi:hypothetical protein
MFKLKLTLSILLFVAVIEASGNLVNRFHNGFSLGRNFRFTERELADPQPPPIEQAAKMARYIVHYSGKFFTKHCKTRGYLNKNLF